MLVEMFFVSLQLVLFELGKLLIQLIEWLVSLNYSDIVIQCCLQIGQVFKQALRQTTGLIRGLLDVMGYPHLPVPNYSTLSRRSKSITVQPVYQPCSSRGKNIAGDSTGLKVFGEGEWKVRKHGYSKRRTWMKMHLFVDVDTQIIVYSVLTFNDIDDGEVAVEFFRKVRRKFKKILRRWCL